MKKLKKTISPGTISKGYRLKPSTHKLIKRVQRLLNTSQDTVISMAVRGFAKGFKKQGKSNNSVNNLITNLNKRNISNENITTF